MQEHRFRRYDLNRVVIHTHYARLCASDLILHTITRFPYMPPAVRLDDQGRRRKEQWERNNGRASTRVAAAHLVPVVGRHYFAVGKARNTLR